MHHRLSQLLETEVVGEVVQVGDGLFDAKLGRICLERLDPDHARQLAQRVRSKFPEAEIRDKLHLQARDRAIRGIVEVQLRDPDMGTLYLLQITSHTVVAYLERRFMLAEHAYADLTAVVCNGFIPLFGRAEAPLKLLSKFDDLYERYLDGLDKAVRQALEGEKAVAREERPEKIDLNDSRAQKRRAAERSSHGTNTTPANREPTAPSNKPRVRVEYLDELPVRRDDPDARSLIEQSDGLRDAWRLIPWSLKQNLEAVSRHDQERLCHHDRVLENTLLFGTDLLEGDRIYQYEHTPLPMEEYEKVLGWMTQLHEDMRRSYPPPEHLVAMAYASSADRFVNHFPGFLPAVGRLYARPPTRSYE